MYIKTLIAVSEITQSAAYRQKVLETSQLNVRVEQIQFLTILTMYKQHITLYISKCSLLERSLIGFIVWLEMESLIGYGC